MSDDVGNEAAGGGSQYYRGITRIETIAVAIQLQPTDLKNANAMAIAKHVIEVFREVRQAETRETIPRIQRLVADIQMCLPDLENEGNRAIYQRTLEMNRVVEEMKTLAPGSQQSSRVSTPFTAMATQQQTPKTVANQQPPARKSTPAKPQFGKHEVVDLTSDDEVMPVVKLEPVIPEQETFERQETPLRPIVSPDSREIRESPPVETRRAIKGNLVKGDIVLVSIKAEVEEDASVRLSAGNHQPVSDLRESSPILEGSDLDESSMVPRSFAEVDADENHAKDLDVPSHSTSKLKTDSSAQISALNAEKDESEPTERTTKHSGCESIKKSKADVYSGPDSDNDDYHEVKLAQLSYVVVAYDILKKKGIGLWVHEAALVNEMRKVYRKHGIRFVEQSLFKALDKQARIPDGKVEKEKRPVAGTDVDSKSTIRVFRARVREASPVLSSSRIDGSSMVAQPSGNDTTDNDSELTDVDDLDFMGSPLASMPKERSSTKHPASSPPGADIAERVKLAKREKVTPAKPRIHDQSESEAENDTADLNDPSWKPTYGIVGKSVLKAKGRGVWVDEPTLVKEARDIYDNRGFAFKEESFLSSLKKLAKDAAIHSNPTLGVVEKRTRKEGPENLGAHRIVRDYRWC